MRIAYITMMERLRKEKNASNRLENNKSRFGLVPKNKVITFGDFQLGSGEESFQLKFYFLEVKNV